MYFFFTKSSLQTYSLYKLCQNVSTVRGTALISSSLRRPTVYSRSCNLAASITT